MAQEQAGSVVSLWRYPVKSMVGEELNASAVTARGLLGDRAYALVDRSDGKVASAKNPRKWPRLFDFRAAYVDTVQRGARLPAVRITLPDGATLTSEQADADPTLSRELHREVTLARAERGQHRLDVVDARAVAALRVTAWSPLGGGLLTGRYGSDRTRPNDTRVAASGQSGLTDRNLAIADIVNAVAAERGASSAQVAIAWVRAQQAHGVIVPILGARRCRQLEDNLGALELELTAEELARLEEVSRIELGFPHDFGADRLAYGTTRPLIDNHRAYGPGQARRQA